MKLFLKYLKPLVGRITLGMSFKFVGSIMDLLLPWILAYIIDSVIPQKRITPIIWWGVVMVICSILAMLTNIIANRMASRVARDTTGRVRHDLFEKIGSLSTAQFDRFGVSSLVSRLTTDTYNIHQTIGMSQRIGIRAPILLIGGIIITATLDPVLTLVLVAVLPFTLITIYIVSKKGIPKFAQLQKQIDALVTVVRENVTGARVIKALSKTPYEVNRFKGVNQDLVAAETSANQTMAITPAFMNFFLNGGLTLVILVAAFRVNSNLTQPGVIVAFLTYFTIILNAMMSITRIFVAFSRGLASANRIEAVLVMPADLKTQSALPILNEEPQSPLISFQQVNFHYPDGASVLEDISLAIPAGSTIGIIGGTGSGKTTLMKLLLRLYDPDSGEIYFKDRPLVTVLKEELYDAFGVVLQKDILFADTIEENIRLGRNLSDSQVEKAIDQAQAREFIEKLPEKRQFQLEAKGSNLSGGQKQRVLLARALAGPPEILVLDDSSSALDYKTDAQLRKNLKQLTQTTKILIAQRISSIAFADQIIVLDHGKIVGH
ncbi:ABC transporter ATP-binding protein [Enterococcus timonensis]|uniref:ABC transporter ATP-binding protein n=1 Tax=Enterococcus timonensis TaxID=1852364 RepID=UPI000A403CB2|nr:ABC transporter ATP-binding protein [Enterococcus timonensis]